MTRPEKVERLVKSRNARTGVRVNRLKAKASKSGVSAKQILVAVFLLILLMGSGIGYVWSNFEGTQIGYDLTELKKEELRLLEINRKLRVELAYLKSLENIEKIAVEQLGLRHPSPEQIIILP
jgi:cell division protein FtsL